MTGLRFALSAVILFWVSACATMEGTVPSGKVEVGQTEANLVEKLGQPQQIISSPQGGKIYVYATHRLDQIAVMGGGAWAKPEQTHYWLDPQGIVTKVDFYPYGKRPFMFPSKEEPAATGAVGAPPAKASQASLTPPPPQEAAPKPEPVKPAPPAASVEAVTRLEPNMTKDEVRRLLGLPDRTEGFIMAGKSIVVWFYPLKNLQGRAISTPLVFEKNRLTGWGELYYQQLHKKAAP